MPKKNDPPGCRDAAIVTAFLLGFGAVMFAVGLTMINGDSCTGWCETLGLTALYAGGPVSAIFGVFTDSIVAAWPLDITSARSPPSSAAIVCSTARTVGFA